MVLWDISPPSSWSAGFTNSTAINCPNTLSLNWLACYAVSSMNLDSVTLLNQKAGTFPSPETHWPISSSATREPPSSSLSSFKTLASSPFCPFKIIVLVYSTASLKINQMHWVEALISKHSQEERRLYVSSIQCRQKGQRGMKTVHFHVKIECLFPLSPRHHMQLV